MAIEKIEIPGAVLELPAKQHCRFSPFGPFFEVNGLDWQCYLAGSSKTAPRMLILSIAIGANYSFDIKSCFSIAPAFSLYKNFDIASVYNDTGGNLIKMHNCAICLCRLLDRQSCVGLFYSLLN